MQGPVDTRFIKKHELELLASHPVTPEPLALGALTFAHLAAQQARHTNRTTLPFTNVEQWVFFQRAL